MVGLLLQVSIDDSATAGFYAIAKRMAQTKPLNQAIGQTLLSSTLRRFAAQSDPSGNPWKKLSKATLKRRGPNAKALLASGRLRQSLTFRASADGVEVGTNVIYARIQQLGSAGLEGGAIQMPERTGTIYRRASDLKNGKSRFVRKSKSDFATDHLIPAHSVVIPGRAYLGLSPMDAKAIYGLAKKFAGGER